ncbi:MAG: PKD domain-containing protein [Methylocystis sp.]
MHFVGYQRSGEEQEFCEDIAQTGPTVIGITAVSPDLRDMAIGVRVVKDVGGEKERADIEAATVFSRPPKVYQNGSMTFEHDFKEPGRYVAIVTVSDDIGNSWTSRFPFTVGVFTVMGVIEYILYGVAFVALCGFLWFMLSQRAKKAEAIQTPLSAREA